MTIGTHDSRFVGAHSIRSSTAEADVGLPIRDLSPTIPFARADATSSSLAVQQDFASEIIVQVERPVSPVLRWVGGKRRMTTRLLSLLPSDIDKRRYLEPFLGAGSLFFALKPKRATLSDANQQLIRCYASIKREPEQVARSLEAHKRAHGVAHYYAVRTQYNAGGSDTVQAARFLYLNAAGFNGVFRVNRQGAYNVPFGRKEVLKLPSRLHLLAVAQLLRRARLISGDYAKALGLASDDSFYYLDPPYPPLNGTSYFTHYTLDRFSHADQHALAESVHRLHSSGAKFLMTNADTPDVRALYSAFSLTPLAVTRWVSCQARRYKVGELAITNYPPR